MKNATSLITHAIIRGILPETACGAPILEIVKTTVLRGGGESTTWHPHVTMRLDGKQIWRGTDYEFHQEQPHIKRFGDKLSKPITSNRSTLYAILP